MTLTGSGAPASSGNGSAEIGTFSDAVCGHDDAQVGRGYQRPKDWLDGVVRRFR